MGIDTTFYMVVGVCVSMSDLIDTTPTTIEVPSCKHSEHARSGKHCSECGRAVKVSVKHMKNDHQNAFEEYVYASDLAILASPYDKPHDKILIGKRVELSPYNSAYFRKLDSMTGPDIMVIIKEFKEKCPVPMKDGWEQGLRVASYAYMSQS